MCVLLRRFAGGSPAFFGVEGTLWESLSSMLSIRPLQAEKIARLDALLEQVDLLVPELQLLPTAPDIVQILTDPATTTAYSDELNTASVIFHNRRTSEASLDDILMTGDAALRGFDAIADRLYHDYYIVKAPHHGTASHWSHWLSEIAASHILISNGSIRRVGKLHRNMWIYLR